MPGSRRSGLLWGTVVSGVVMNVLDALVNGIFFLRDFQANAERLGLDPGAADSLPGLVIWVTMDFVFGFVLAWLYGALRPAGGAGAATALRAGAALYVPTTCVILGFGVLGMLTPPLLVKMAVSGAAVVGVGALAAGRTYEKVAG
jgi:hypothetical protein